MAAKQTKRSAKFAIENYPLFAMAHILSHAQSRIVNAIRGYRMTPSAWRVLSMLAEVDEIKINDLARRIVVERSALSRLIAKLEGDGLISRRAHPRDGRSVTLHLSAKGKKLYDKSAPIARRELESLLSELDVKERILLQSLLDRIRRKIPALPEWVTESD